MSSEPKLTSFSDIETRRLDYIWNPYIPNQSITLLDANPGFGKSQISLSLAMSVANGLALPNCRNKKVASGRPVLLMNTEDDAHAVIKPRLNAIGGNLDNIVLFTMFKKDGKLRQVTLDQTEVIEKAVRQVRPRFIIIDPIVCFIPATINPYIDLEVRQILAPIAVLAQKYEFAVLIVRHSTKVQHANAQHRGGGSYGGFVGTARSQLTLGYAPDSKVCLAHAKMNAGRLGDTVQFEIADQGYDSFGNSLSRIEWGVVRSEIHADQLTTVKPTPKATPVEALDQRYAVLLEDSYTEENLAFAWNTSAAQTKMIANKLAEQGKLRQSVDRSKWIVVR